MTISANIFEPLFVHICEYMDIEYVIKPPYFVFYPKKNSKYNSKNKYNQNYDFDCFKEFGAY